jgi:ubiquinone/menaquinone biosynthesis C-methylase UbiE
MTDLNPQAKPMADESMARNLDAQARAIWPQESQLFPRYGLSGAIRILDAGCGTGEISSRLADMFPKSEILAVDVIEERIAMATERFAALASRLRFEVQSVYELQAADNTFDLTVCRHVTHSIPFADKVYAELARVTKPGGRLHLIPEDYGMLHFQVGALDPRDFWRYGPDDFGVKTNTDLMIGRDTYSMLVDLGMTDITVDYVVVDTARVPRETFAGIITAWKDGYVEPIAEMTRFSADQTRAYFDQMIADILNPRRYACWMVPVIAAKVPA